MNFFKLTDYCHPPALNKYILADNKVKNKNK